MTYVTEEEADEVLNNGDDLMENYDKKIEKSRKYFGIEDKQT